MKDIWRTICCELTGSEALDQAMFDAWLTERPFVVPRANQADMDTEISEEQYQAGLVQIRKQLPAVCQWFLSQQLSTQIVKFWEKQKQKTREN